MARRIVSMKISTDTIGNQPCDLLVCSAVHVRRTLAEWRAVMKKVWIINM